LYGIGHSSIPDSAKALLENTGLSLIVVTLGDKGAYAVSRGEVGVYSPGYKIKLVDPCGSGDAFTAAFLTSLLEGEQLKTALQNGNALGALVATQKGATQPVTEEEISAFLESGPELCIAEKL
jgi:sugar/nucleoside kinase (ribokinase family)